MTSAFGSESCFRTELERVLYLDSDIIVRGDLRPLWEKDLSQYVVAVVPDALPQAFPSIDAELRRKLSLGSDTSYFNAGVMLINLIGWRNENVGPELRAFCKSNPDKLTFWDQCALNTILKGKALTVSYIWNLQSAHLRIAEIAGHKSTYKIAEPRIVHFTGPYKPWQCRCTHPAPPSIGRY